MLRRRIRVGWGGERQAVGAADGEVDSPVVDVQHDCRSRSLNAERVALARLDTVRPVRNDTPIVFPSPPVQLSVQR